MMKTAFGNSACLIICWFCLLFSFSFLQAQEQKKISDIEKIYLHTDRSTYCVGEDLWYKAYDVRAYNNILFDRSNLLYVELINSESRIIARNKTNIEMGLGYGDFQLTDSLGVKPGKYQLRAYTNWDRNFGEDFVFKKEIEILDVFEMHSKTPAAVKTTPVKKTAATPDKPLINENEFQIDFFPEGGSLLENTASIVGFKAVDSGGNPIEVNGEIYDSANDLIGNFQSVHDGMGKFQMIPLEGKNYYAKIKTANGLSMKKDLPQATKLGYLLSYRNVKGRNFVTISTNQSTLTQNPSAALQVQCTARGISYLETTQTMSELSLSFELPKDKTPEGISQITIFDATNKPQSERLVYIEKESDLLVQLIADKVIYTPNEKATISVSSKSKEGAVKSASYSMSVTDMNGVLDEKEYESNICSYFLMEADIRGKVNRPAYYFDTNNPKRLEHLDNLLLTQGWRDFVWKNLAITNDDTFFKVEKGITISGRVKQLFANKPLENSYVSLALMNKKRRNFFSVKPDSVGIFKFENMMFSGKTNMFLTSVNEKGKFRGEIILDTLEQAPILTSFKNESFFWSGNTRLIAENIFKKNVAFGVKPENILNEVNITAKKKVTSKSYFGLPENSYVSDEDVKTFTNIYDLITQKIPGVINDGDSVRFLRNQATPLFVLNGFQVTKSEIDVIQPQDVERIDVIRGMQATMFFGEEAADGLIAIYIKPNAANRSKERSYAIKQELDGYYIERVFYNPTPEQVQLDLDNKLSVRNTLYWNPYVHPDKQGNATVSYYNTKAETKVKVNLQGMTAGGVPVFKNVFYSIKK
ncbi:Plug domain-containing protein [Flavobacterium flavipallidum]|uniref:Plug domain-containing protein n=1 Tax=Flavobacterium flavipallidum TaxID=3139140 RepID=A0ABU9HNS2_9FLAO